MKTYKRNFQRPIATLLLFTHLSVACLALLPANAYCQHSLAVKISADSTNIQPEPSKMLEFNTPTEESKNEGIAERSNFSVLTLNLFFYLFYKVFSARSLEK